MQEVLSQGWKEEIAPVMVSCAKPASAALGEHSSSGCGEAQRMVQLDSSDMVVNPVCWPRKSAYVQQTTQSASSILCDARRRVTKEHKHLAISACLVHRPHEGSPPCDRQVGLQFLL